MKISVKAPAKINLSLDVLHKREDGFHEVKMVMTTVDLADRVDLVDLQEDKIIVETTSGFVPSDKRNLAYQAAYKLKERYGVLCGVKIHIDKRIPVAAGLAGGSSDAAATLKGLNQLWDLQLSLDELAEIGSEIGSDVAFCVYGGTALATGRGEIIEKIASPPPLWVVLAKPDISVSTKDVYQNLRLQHVTHPNVDRMVKALEEENIDKIYAHLGNVLESVTLKKHPEVQQIKEHIEQLGGEGVLMSGSGPTVFGLTRHATRARRIYNGLRGFCNEVYVVRLLGNNDS